MREIIHCPPGASMGPEMILPDQRNWGEYEKFLERKRFTPIVSGMTALPVKVDRNLNPRLYTKALRAKPYDLIFLLDPGKGRDALIRLAPKGVPVLSTTDRRTESNAQLLETCKRLLSRKRGPIPAVRSVRVVAEVA